MKKTIDFPKLPFLILISIFSLFLMINIDNIDVVATTKIAIQRYSQDGENLDIAFTGIKSPKEKNMKAFIGNQSFLVNKIENSANYKEGISYIFVVDVSGSVQSAQYELMEKTMTNLVRKSNTDNIKIFLVGDKVVSFDIASGSDDDMIDKIRTIRTRASEAGEYQTALYSGITQALKETENDDEMNLVRAMVVFSDGFEEKGESLTIGEVEDAIKESRIPIYTVPVAPGVDIGGGQDTTEILASFARLSKGGKAVPFSDIYSVDNIVEQISKSISKINIASINLKQLKTGNDIRDLKLEYSGKSDRVELDISELDLTNLNTQNPQNDSQTASNDTSSNNKKSLPVVPIIIAMSIVAIAIIVFIVIKSINSSKVTLILNIGNKDIKKHMKDKFIMGRDTVKSHFAMPNDNMLSNMHCMIYINNKNLFIKDLDSTNGTYLNGKKLKSDSPLSKGDILLIGSVEMKISWE